MKNTSAIVTGLALLLGACSTVMEAERPAPVNLSKYSVGEQRMDVISTLGGPVSSVKDGDNSCDIYKLYTTGNNKNQKAAVILGEAGADIFTLGLFEVVATPAEALTKSKAHTVLVCYSPAGALVSMRDEGAVVTHPAAGAAGGSSSAPPATTTAADTPK